MYNADGVPPEQRPRVQVLRARERVSPRLDEESLLDKM